MSISTDQKLDYLWKKVGYGAAKRDINSVLNATQEGVPSPLLLRGDNVWAQSGDVPGTMPASSSGVVTVKDNGIALGTETTGDYVESLVAGTGVTLANNSGEGATPTVAIGQAVGTTDAVTFGDELKISK